MSLRLFIDQCVPSIIPRGLRGHGFDVVELKERLPIRSLDPTVIAQAVSEDRVLITLNSDFSNLLAFPPNEFTGIIALQMHGHQTELAPYNVKLIQFLAEHPNQDYFHGKLFLFEIHRVRVRT